MANASLNVFLLDDVPVMALIASYQPQPETNSGDKAKAWTPDVSVFKTFDLSIKPGDTIVVPTDIRHKTTTVKVEKVKIPPDFDWGQEVRWVVGKVDMPAYEKTLEQDKDLADKVAEVALRKKKAQLRKDLMDDSAGEFDKLPIATAHRAPALSPPQS